MLIVVTGSRDWPISHNSVVINALEECMRAAFDKDDVLQLRVGDARGVDRVAFNWATIAHRRKWAVDQPREYKAKWRDQCIPGRCKPGHRRPDSRGDVCPLQGYVRNELMVDDDPTPSLLLAFIHEQSRGATQCYDYAKSKGIDTVPFRLSKAASRQSGD